MSRVVRTDLEVLDRLVRPPGTDVVDIGCGGGALVRALPARGARMIGVEVSEQQVAPAVAGDVAGGGARYLVGSAQRLPLDDASVDAAVFMRSLHHVPPPAALDRAADAGLERVSTCGCASPTWPRCARGS